MGMLTQSINDMVTQKTEQNVYGMYVVRIIYVGSKTQPTICDGGPSASPC